MTSKCLFSENALSSLYPHESFNFPVSDYYCPYSHLPRSFCLVLCFWTRWLKVSFTNSFNTLLWCIDDAHPAILSTCMILHLHTHTAHVTGTPTLKHPYQCGWSTSAGNKWKWKKRSELLTSNEELLAFYFQILYLYKMYENRSAELKNKSSSDPNGKVYTR